MPLLEKCGHQMGSKTQKRLSAEVLAFCATTGQEESVGKAMQGRSSELLIEVCIERAFSMRCIFAVSTAPSRVWSQSKDLCTPQLVCVFEANAITLYQCETELHTADQCIRRMPQSQH